MSFFSCQQFSTSVCLPLYDRLLKVSKETENNNGDLAEVEGLRFVTDNVLVLLRLQPIHTAGLQQLTDQSVSSRQSRAEHPSNVQPFPQSLLLPFIPSSVLEPRHARTLISHSLNSFINLLLFSSPLTLWAV